MTRRAELERPSLAQRGRLAYLAGVIEGWRELTGREPTEAELARCLAHAPDAKKPPPTRGGGDRSAKNRQRDRGANLPIRRIADGWGTEPPNARV